MQTIWWGWRLYVHLCCHVKGGAWRWWLRAFSAWKSWRAQGVRGGHTQWCSLLITSSVWKLLSLLLSSNSSSPCLVTEDCHWKTLTHRGEEKQWKEKIIKEIIKRLEMRKSECNIINQDKIILEVSECQCLLSFSTVDFNATDCRCFLPDFVVNAK